LILLERKGELKRGGGEEGGKNLLVLFFNILRNKGGEGGQGGKKIEKKKKKRKKLTPFVFLARKGGKKKGKKKGEGGKKDPYSGTPLQKGRRAQGSVSHPLFFPVISGWGGRVRDMGRRGGDRFDDLGGGKKV